MTQLRQLLLVAIFFLSGSVFAQSILFVATSPVPPGKFNVIAEIAQKHGLTVESHFAERITPEKIDQLFNGHDAVIFDAARSHMQDAVKRRLAKPLAELKTRHIWMRDNGPQAEGFAKARAEQLHAYYINGGRSNFDSFLATLAAELRGQAAPEHPAPFVFPESAVYHPKAPNTVFATPAEYFQWRGIDLNKRPPTVAIAMHQIYLGAEQTRFIDDLIARIEAGGAIALPDRKSVV